MKPHNEAPCPYCKAAPGEECTTWSGRPLTSGQACHVTRWDARRSLYRRPRRYVMRADDPQFQLSEGDVLICEPYWLDPAEKVCVLYRESDGYVPECNQYRHAVKPILGPSGEVSS